MICKFRSDINLSCFIIPKLEENNNQFIYFLRLFDEMMDYWKKINKF